MGGRTYLKLNTFELCSLKRNTGLQPNVGEHEADHRLLGRVGVDAAVRADGGHARNRDASAPNWPVSLSGEVDPILSPLLPGLIPSGV